jgi:hypothetical protein
MEHEIYPFHGVFERALIADVTNVEFDLVGHFRHPCLEVVTHVILLLFIT